MDYSKLSDAQLLALHSQDYSKLSNDELKDLHQQQQPPQPEGWGKTLLRGGLETLPALGAVGVGALGGATTGLAAVPGAALGYGLGKQAERLGKQYLLGDKEGNVPTQPIDQAWQGAKDTAEGVIAELGGQAVGNGLSSAGQYLAGKLKDTGVAAAIRHLRPTPQVARSLGKEGLSDMGEEALQSGAIKPFQKVGQTAENLGNLTNEVGAVKGDIVNQSPATVNPEAVIGRVQKNVINPLDRTTAGKRVSQAIKDRLEALKGDLGDNAVPVSRIEAEKSAEQEGINYLAPSKAAKKADKGYASQLRQASEDAITTQDPDNAPAFLAAKESYGNLEQGRQMAQRTAGLTDGGTGLMGHIADVGTAAASLPAAAHFAANGQFLQAAIAASVPVARAIIKGRVASTIATGAYGAGKALQSAVPQYSGTVAKAISSRGASNLGQNRDIQSPDTLRQNLINQQTNHDAQKQLKDSQE